MIITFSKEFRKEYKKLPKKIQKKVSNRIELFFENQNHPQLNNHRLHGEYKNYYRINVTGDIRAIYEFLDKKTLFFVKIGTHTQLY